MALLMLPQVLQRQPPNTGGIDYANALTRGLVGIMAPEGATWAERVRNRAIGTIGGAVTQNERFVGRALNGSNGVSTARNAWSDWERTGALTFATMIRLSAYSSAGPFAGNTSGTNGYFVGQRFSDGTFTARVGGSGALNSASGALRVGVDHVCVVTFDGSVATSYLDGKVIASQSGLTASAFDTFCAAFIGTSPGGVGVLSGVGYWSALWDHALTPGEIRALAANPWQLWVPRAVPVFNVASGGSTTYNVSTDEAATLADTVTATAALAGSVAESAALADSTSATAAVAGSVAESAVLADTVNAAAAMGAAVAEAASLVDAQSAAATFPAAVAESVALADSGDAIVTKDGTVAEAIGLADTASATVVYAASVGEVLALADVQDATGGTAASAFGGVALRLFPQPSRTREWLDKEPRRVRRAVARAVEAPERAREIIDDALPDLAEAERALEAVQALVAQQAEAQRMLQEAVERQEARRRQLEDEDDDDAAVLLLLH